MPSEETERLLPSWRRLHSHQEFERALNSSRRSNKWFAAYSCSNDFTCSRLGMIVSKKVMPKSVSRNFAKRLIREAFRQNMPQALPLDVVIQPRRQISPSHAADGRQALKELLAALST